MSRNFLDAIQHRRSYYGIDKQISLSPQQIEDIIKTAVLHTPSAFNSQSARVLLLLGEHHARLWDIVMSALRKKVPAEKFSPTEEKINSFAAGYGSVVFFEDMTVVEQLQKNFPSYKDNFPLWSQQSNGMLQLVIWTALEDEGLGASIQHYNPLIDDDVKKEWNVDPHWKLIAQMPFGNPTQTPGEKDFSPIDSRVFIYT